MNDTLNSFMRPLMRAWHVEVLDSLSTAPRARGVPQAHASGLDPDRILIFGTGLIAGWGVATHDLALPGELARALSSITNRGADIDLFFRVPLSSADAIKYVNERDLAGYDAVLLTLGTSDALFLTPRAQWRASMRALIEAFLARLSQSGHIFVVEQIAFPSVPPFEGRFGRAANSHVNTLNAVVRELCDRYSRVDYVTLPPSITPEAGRLVTPEQYKKWARSIAPQLAPHLNREASPPVREESSSARSHRERAQSDQDRYDAIDRLGLITSGADDDIDRIVATARAVFGTLGAAFSVVGRDRQWNKSIVGLDVTEVPLELSQCVVTVQGSTPIIVADARLDPRFSPESLIAFYAGYPIESPDGQRIGALCVFDTSPRDLSQVDPIVLRDFALRIQDQLWHYPLSPDDASTPHELEP